MEHADVYYLCGESNRKLGNLAIAEQMFLKCLRYEFHSPYVYSSLAYVYKEIGHTEKAASLFKRSLE